MTPGRIHSIPEEGNGDEGSQHVMAAEGESGKFLSSCIRKISNFENLAN